MDEGRIRKIIHVDMDGATRFRGPGWRSGLYKIQHNLGR
jgi:hypothetical protein